VFKPNSHLWVVNPTNVTELFERLKPRLPALTPARPPVRPSLVPAAATPAPAILSDLAFASTT
jgi:hypothetical protein